MSRLEQASNSVAQRTKKITRALVKARKNLLEQENLQTGGSKLYLRGTFISFEEASQRLQIRIEGDHYYYPLSDYYGSWIPRPNSPVIITRMATNNKEIAIQGFDRQGLSIPYSEILALEVRSVDDRNGVIAAYSDEIGFFQINLPESIIEKGAIVPGKMQLFRRVTAIPKTFLIPHHCNNTSRNPLDIYRMTR